MYRIVFLLMFLLLPMASAKTVTFGMDEISISIRYGLIDGSKESIPTYLRFPRAIARIDNATMFSIKPASSTGLQPDYREIEIKPRVSEGSQRVEFLLNDGTVVRLRLKITVNPDIPVSYDFEAKRVHEKANSSLPQAQGQIADLSVMRTILEGGTPAGFSKKSYSMQISCSGNCPNANLLRVFENNQFKVFQVEISNDSTKKSFQIKEENVVLKVRDLSRSPLIHVKSNVLGPSGKGQNKTVMTIVTDPSANINKMRICDIGDQIESIETKSKVSK